MNNRQSNNRLLAAVLSVGAAALMLVLLGIILPAAYNRDPLGTGHLLGLVDAPGGLQRQFEPHRSDHVEFVLEPFQSLEYKYLMDQRSALVFSWRASGDLYFDLHADDGTQPDHSESSLQGVASTQMGTYIAPFNGMHGWFWENRTFDTVTLRLATSGFYIHATERRLGSSTDRTPAAALD